MNPIAEKARALSDKIASIPLRDVLDQMADELDRRDDRVAELEAKLKESRGVVASLLLATELMQEPEPTP